MTDPIRVDPQRRASRKYYVKNRRRLIAKSRAYRLAHPIKVRNTLRAWRNKNAKKHHIAKQEWQLQNWERHLEICRKYNASHPTKKIRSSRAWRISNPKEMERCRRAWSIAHPRQVALGAKMRRARKHSASGTYSLIDIDRIRDVQKDLCRYCSIPLGGGGTVDHKIPLVRGGSNYPKNLCLACRSCNSRKGAKTSQEYLRAL